jgi:hypothetical protein
MNTQVKNKKIAKAQGRFDDARQNWQDLLVEQQYCPWTMTSEVSIARTIMQERQVILIAVKGA